MSSRGGDLASRDAVGARTVHRLVRPSTVLLPAILLAWTVAVTLARMSELATGPPRLRAHGERAFFGWAWRGDELRKELSAAGSRFAPGERVWVVSSDPGVDSGWLGVMAIYYLQGQVVVGVGPASAGERRGATLLAVGGPTHPPPVPGAAARRAADFFGTALGAALVLLVGHAALGDRRRFSLSELAAEGAVGLALVCLFVFLLGSIGLPLRLWTISVYEILLAAILFRFRAPAHAAREGGKRARDPLTLACELAAVLAFAAACWKWARVPLWSWDHYAIWGMKARRIIADGRLDLGFLKLPAFLSSVPGYPVGLPIAWRVVHPGLPGAAAFKLCHALFAAGLLASIRAAAIRIAGSPALAAALAALVAVSPLFWDTEALGLAEMPLAFIAVSAIALFLRARDDLFFPAWPAGLALGFLSWIKAEGALLGLLLAGVAVLSLPPTLARFGRVRGARPILLPALAAIASAALVERAFLGAGVSFFQGDWSDRVAARLRDGAGVLILLGRELLQPDWLGVWPIVAVGFVFAIAAQKRVCVLLLAAVGAQMASYAAVYFATYLDPAAHIRSSFFRIAAGLAPLAILGAGAAFAARSPGVEVSATGEAEATAVVSRP